VEDSPGPRLHPVSTKAALASGLVTAALVLIVVWLFEVSLERAAVLAPVIVVVFGAAAAVVVVWAKVGWEALQRHRRPWLVAGLVAGVVAVIAVLSLLGLDLPRE
jgi:amino acid permease